MKGFHFNKRSELDKLGIYYTKIYCWLLNRRNNLSIKIGDGTVIQRGCTINNGNIKIGDEVFIAEGCSLNGNIKIKKRTNIGGDSFLVGDVDIREYCAIANKVRFRNANHSMHQPVIQGKFNKQVLREEKSIKKDKIKVGPGAWIGMRATILGGVKIGHGAIIGAGAVVTKDVKPFSITAGNPAEHKKWRFDEETRNQLKDIRWWKWSDEKIKANKEFFRSDLRKVSNIDKIIKK